MTQVILLIRGLPGSGKSILARAIAASTGAVPCEADDYFVGGDALAHEACFAKCRIALDEGYSVVVANTFSQKWEMRAYNKEAVVRGIPCLTVTANGSWQNVRGVPDETIQWMRERWEA